MPQTASILSNNLFIPKQVELKDTVFFPQEKYQCGPAALATVLNSANVNVLPGELVAQVYIAERKGSLQLEITAATRRYNRVPYIIKPELKDLLTEVAAGNPVLILLNQSFNWAPVWHYAVVVGFDLNEQHVILRSGLDKRVITSMSLFERTWARANRWGMVVTTLDKLPNTASEFEYTKSAANFEKINKAEQALHAYKTALKKWPNSLTLHIALGNAYYKLHMLNEAETTLKNATTLHPLSETALNNLAFILLEQNKLQAAHEVSMRANKLQKSPNQSTQNTLKLIEQKADNTSTNWRRP